MVESEIYKNLEEISSNLIRLSYSEQESSYTNAIKNGTTKCKSFRFKIHVDPYEITSANLANALTTVIFKIFPEYKRKFKSYSLYNANHTNSKFSPHDLLVS